MHFVLLKDKKLKCTCIMLLCPDIVKDEILKCTWTIKQSILDETEIACKSVTYLSTGD